MNSNFYNGRYTLILKEEVKDLLLPTNVDVYHGNIEKICFDIKKKEIDNDTFYNGHLIVNNKELLKDLDIKNHLRKDLLENVVYVKNVIHSGKTSECKINDEIILCTSFNLPMIANYKRTKNTLYGNCWLHRIKIKTLWEE